MEHLMPAYQVLSLSDLVNDSEDYSESDLHLMPAYQVLSLSDLVNDSKDYSESDLHLCQLIKVRVKLLHRTRCEAAHHSAPAQ